MHEDITMSSGAHLDLFGYEPRTALLKIADDRGQIGDMQGDVVQPFAALCDEFRDHRIVAGGLQQFNAALAHGNHRHLNLFMGDNFLFGHLRPKVLIEPARLGQRFDGDTEMVDGHEGSWLLYWLLASSCWLLASGFWLLAN